MLRLCFTLKLRKCEHEIKLEIEQTPIIPTAQPIRKIKSVNFTKTTVDVILIVFNSLRTRSDERYDGR